jgi:integrase/recombinase XerD
MDSQTGLVAVQGGALVAGVAPGTAAVMDYLARFRSAAGRNTMRGCLETLAKWQGSTLETWEPHRLGVLGVRAVVAKIQAQPWSAATKAKYEACLSGVLKSCWRVGALDTDTMTRARDWQRTRVSRAEHAQAAGRYVTKAERARMWDAATKTGTTDTATKRDQLFTVLLFCGLRREETTTLDVEHIQGDVLTVPGKGQKLRQVTLEAWMVDVLFQWLAVRGPGPGPLLRPLGKYGQVGGGRWSVAAASKRAAELLEAAGLEDVGCHDFRRTYASDALEAGVDVATVAKSMGHSSVRTTQSYDRRGIDALRQVAKTVWKPF